MVQPNLGHRVLLLALLVACGSPVKPTPAPGPAYDPSVIYIVIDGLRTDECTLEAVSAVSGQPGVDQVSDLWQTVAADGAVVRALQNPGVTVTGPSHVQMVTGRIEEIANFPVDPSLGVGEYLPSRPTLFELLRAAGLGPESAVLAHNAPLVTSARASLYPGMGIDLGAQVMTLDRDKSTIDAVVDLINTSPPRFLLVNLHETDLMGHGGDLGEYPSAASRASELVADLYRWIKAEHPTYWDNLLFVVTSDHGRHRSAGEESWREHGDACSGCRDLPLFIAGGGVSARGEVAGDLDQLDLTATVAAWLGVDLAFAEGRTLPELVKVAPRAPVGDRDVVLAGGNLAWRRHTGDAAQRAEVVVNGEVVSDGARYVDGIVVSGEADPTVCWRELPVARGHDQSWLSRCKHQADGVWTDIGFPEAESGAFGTHTFLSTAAGLQAFYVYNPASGMSDPHIGLSVATLGADLRWTAGARSFAWVPSHPSVTVHRGAPIVAIGRSSNESSGRYNRSIGVFRGDPDAWAPLATVTFAEVLPLGRIERPALRSDGVKLQLAALGAGSGDRVLLYTESPTDGTIWTPPSVIPTEALYYYLSPVWDDHLLVWAQSHAGLNQICRADPVAPAPECLDLEGDVLDSFAVEDGRVVASVRIDGVWTRVEHQFAATEEDSGEGG